MGPCAGRPHARCLLGIVVVLAAGVGCKTSPTTILLHIQANPKLGEVDELRLSVLNLGGAPIRDRRLPDSGKPSLPGEVVLYPHDSDGTLRLWVRALRLGAAVGDGATTATVQPGRQTEATVLIAAATLPDRDGDGIPDAVDNCPDLANPKQEPCVVTDLGPPDAAREGPGDAPRIGEGGTRDLAPEARADLPQCDVDGDGHLAQSCGGDDCDDKNPLVHPKRNEGPPGDASCSDGLDNDCDGGSDLADTECRTCLNDSECDDHSVCTNDSCSSGQCKSSPANNGAICDDGNACTGSTVCQAGFCAGGTPVSCTSPTPCKLASCDPTKGCVLANASNGKLCDDGLYCTVNDSCNAGACTGGGARNCQGGLTSCQQGSCNESQNKCDVTSLANGTLCDDQDPCTQGESCQQGSCAAPALLDELISTVYNIANGLDRTIRVDSKGKVHAVVTVHNGSVASAIRYWSNASGSWSEENVSSIGGANGGYPSLVLDGSDQPHLVFVNPSTSKVHYAKRAGTPPTWTVSEVALGQRLTSLAIDAAGTLHLAYLAGQLQYAVKPAAAAAWQSYPISNGDIKNASEAEISLALDAGGKPQIAFGDGGDLYGGKLRHATVGATPASWTVVDPPGLPTAYAGYHPSLAITSGGTVQIAHFVVTPSPAGSALRLTTRVGTTWSSQTVTSSTGAPQYPGLFLGLTLDSLGNAQIAHRDSLSDELRFSSNLGGSWKHTTLAKGNNVGRWVSLTRAASGRLHVLYEKEIGYDVRHAAFSACP